MATSGVNNFLIVILKNVVNIFKNVLNIFKNVVNIFKKCNTTKLSELLSFVNSGLPASVPQGEAFLLADVFVNTK